MSAPSPRDLGRAVRELRKRRELTIEAVALAAQLHPTYLSGIERGCRNPSWVKVCALADALGTTIVDVALGAESAQRERAGIEAAIAQGHDQLPPRLDSVCSNNDAITPNPCKILDIDSPAA